MFGTKKAQKPTNYYLFTCQSCGNERVWGFGGENDLMPDVKRAAIGCEKCKVPAVLHVYGRTVDGKEAHAYRSEWSVARHPLHSVPNGQ